jgi:hypothetical protein
MQQEVPDHAQSLTMETCWMPTLGKNKMNKKTVIEELKAIQDFDNERNHAECLLLNLIDDQDVSNAFLEAEERTQTGYRQRTVRCGDDELETIRAMQMISQIMEEDLNEAQSKDVLLAWFNAQYGTPYSATVTSTI